MVISSLNGGKSVTTLEYQIPPPPFYKKNPFRYTNYIFAPVTCLLMGLLHYTCIKKDCAAPSQHSPGRFQMTREESAGILMTSGVLDLSVT